jgi:hypothetical protein
MHHIVNRVSNNDKESSISSLVTHAFATGEALCPSSVPTLLSRNSPKPSFATLPLRQESVGKISYIDIEECVVSIVTDSMPSFFGEGRARLVWPCYHPPRGGGVRVWAR